MSLEVVHSFYFSQRLWNFLQFWAEIIIYQSLLIWGYWGTVLHIWCWDFHNIQKNLSWRHLWPNAVCFGKLNVWFTLRSMLIHVCELLLKFIFNPSIQWLLGLKIKFILCLLQTLFLFSSPRMCFSSESRYSPSPFMKNEKENIKT